MPTEQVTVDFSKPIPLFPLNACILFPHATVPLHMFEPRYRAMTRDAIDSSGLVATATFEGDAWQSDYAGNPPLRPCVCIGYVLQHERLSDGRYNLMLHGVARARIVDELEPDEDGYRRARLAPFGAEPEFAIDLDDTRRRLDLLLDDPLLQRLAVVSTVRKWAKPEVPTPVLADLGMLSVTRDVDKRYSVLCEANASKRSAMFLQEMQAMRDVVARSPEGSEVRDGDGNFLN